MERANQTAIPSPETFLASLKLVLRARSVAYSFEILGHCTISGACSYLYTYIYMQSAPCPSRALGVSKEFPKFMQDYVPPK
jgi:hypothetical protein